MSARFFRPATLRLPAIAIASLIVATQAPAQDSRPVVVYGESASINTERVPYGDLNLRASADRKTLYGRVGRAVRNVCNFDSSAMTTDYRFCSAGAWSGARPQIHAAMARSGQLALSAQSTAATYITISR
jgi:UrcA family protein